MAVDPLPQGSESNAVGPSRGVHHIDLYSFLFLVAGRVGLGLNS